LTTHINRNNRVFILNEFRRVVDASIATVENENYSSDRLPLARDHRRRRDIFPTTLVVVMTNHRSSRSSMKSSSSSGDSCLKYQLVEVDPCGLHGGRIGCLSMVTDWLWRAVYCQREVCVPQIRFPENLFVSVVHDRDVVVAVLKKSSLAPNSCFRGKLRTSGCCGSSAS